MQTNMYCSVQIWIRSQGPEAVLLASNYMNFESRLTDLKMIVWHGLGLLLLGKCEVSVVVPALNEAKYISKCLKSLNRQDFCGEFEIIVVDGGSSDGTIELAKSIADRVVIEKCSNVGLQRNIGAKFAVADKLAFIDADTMASQGWLRSISECLSYSNVVGVTGPTLPYEGSAADLIAYRATMGWLQHLSIVFGLPHVGAANCAYRREPFLRCGGFEESRALSEDLALSLKMKHEGQLVFNKKMIAYTSTRRVRSYGYVRLAMFYLLNDAIFALTGRSLYYPPVR